MKRMRPNFITVFLLILLMAAIVWWYLAYGLPRNEDIVSAETIKYSYTDMTADLRKLEDDYGYCLRVETAGESLDGRNIYNVSIGSEDAPVHILIAAGVHSCDYIGTLAVMRQAEELCTSYRSGKVEGIRYRDLMSRVCIHIMPMVCPDGVTMCQNGVNTVRNIDLRGMLYDCFLKEGLNLGDLYWELWKSNARGVDLNRNFDYGWDEYKEGPVSFSAEGYKGTAPGSEPEVQALLKMAEKYDVDCVISLETIGGTVYGGPAEELDRPAMTAAAAMRGETAGASDMTVAGMEEKLSGIICDVTGYEADQRSSYGSCGSYFDLTLGVPAVTVELLKGRTDKDYPLQDTMVRLVLKETDGLLDKLAYGFYGEQGG